MALNKLTKIQTLGIGSNIEVVGVITTGQFKSGTSNLHASGVELTNLNVSGIATIGGNVSIGGTLTYQDVTNIDSVGIITARSTIDAQGDVSIADKIIHTGDTNTAIRFPSADTITFETAGSERARIDSNGFVGIKETSPHLYYSPDLVVKAAAENGGITIRSAGTTHNNYLMFADGNSGDSRYDGYIKYNHNSRQFDFATAATTRLSIDSSGDVIIGSGTPDGKLHIDAIGSGDIVAELTSGSPTFTYRNGSGSWMHAGKHPTANEFIISEGGTTTGVEMLRIQGGGGATNSKFKFPSVESPSAHGHSTADVEIGGRHIWKRITSANHVTTSTSTNHFYLAFWRSESGSQRTCYYKGVVVNVTASGNYDWGGHGFVTHSSQTLLAFSSTTGGTARFLINEGYNYINNTNGGTNMKINSVSFSHDSTYLYANFKFTTNISGTGFKPHYNIEVIDPNQCTYTCVAF